MKNLYSRGKVREPSQKGHREGRTRGKTVRQREMEAISGPGTEIKAVLHEINGGPHKQYMNHSPQLQ